LANHATTGVPHLLVSEYWPHFYAMLYARNPKHGRTLAKYAPEKMSA